MWFPFMDFLRRCGGTGVIIDYFPRDLFGLFDEEDEQKVDRLASIYAMNIYGKPLSQLTVQQESRVRELARSRFRK